jgi:hypothetical protein
MTAVTHPRSRSLDLSLFRGARSYYWLAGLSLLFGLFSLLWPSTPSYDPWSWLIWGREILHGHLTIAGGSSWKPLPVVFTTVFALFGSAQPDLWLVVARAGAALTVLMSVKLTVRITWSLVSSSRPGIILQEQGWRGRAVAVAPVAFAGTAALICTTFTPHYPGNMLLGYSEGVMTAAFLIAAERAWDGHHRQAFVLGIIPCLDRPEVWPIWFLYGLWLMWHDRGARRLVIGMVVLMLGLWMVPQKLGGGTLLGLATHAQNNHSKSSAVNTSFPFWNELAYTLWPLVIERLEAATLLLIAYTAYLVLGARRQLGNWGDAVRKYPAAVAASLAGAFGFLWWLGISLETQAGFAGNPRYAVIGVMFVCISGCAAYGWACIGLAALGARGLQWLQRRTGGEAGSSPSQWIWLVAAATLLVLLVFARVPDSFTKRMPTVNSIRYNLRYQAHLRNEVAEVIQRAGGAQKLINCGAIMANNLQVTMVAWDLDKKIPWIQALPKKLSTTSGPNVVFQDGATSTRPDDQGPTWLQMATWEAAWKERNGTQYKIFRTPAVTLYMDCSTYSRGKPYRHGK